MHGQNKQISIAIYTGFNVCLCYVNDEAMNTLTDLNPVKYN